MTNRKRYVTVGGTKLTLTQPCYSNPRLPLKFEGLTDEQCEGCGEAVTEGCALHPDRASIICNCGTQYSIVTE